MKYFTLFFFILSKISFSQSDSLSAPDKISVKKISGIYTRLNGRRKNLTQFIFMDDGSFTQSGWRKRGIWEIINDTIYCHGKVPAFSLHRLTLHTDRISWKMILVNGHLYKIKFLLNKKEYRLGEPYFPKKYRNKEAGPE